MPPMKRHFGCYLFAVFGFILYLLEELGVLEALCLPDAIGGVL